MIRGCISWNICQSGKVPLFVGPKKDTGMSQVHKTCGHPQCIICFMSSLSSALSCMPSFQLILRFFSLAIQFVILVSCTLLANDVDIHPFLIQTSINRLHDYSALLYHSYHSVRKAIVCKHFLCLLQDAHQAAVCNLFTKTSQFT